MELNVETCEQIRELLRAGREEELENIVWSGETLAGAMHVACLEKEVRSSSATRHIFFRFLDAWDYLPCFQRAREAIKHQGLWSIPLRMKAEVRAWEILPVPSEVQVADVAWRQFHMRFEASMRECGFAGKLPRALTGALSEMADNSLRHSGSSIKSPAMGAVGYSVDQGQMTFCVVDVGRGVLSSLQSNKVNAFLKDDVTALRAAVLEKATSTDKEFGDGFEQVHRALADLNGRLRFRSGSARLEIDGRGDHRQIDPVPGMAPAVGFQVVVRCALDGFTNDSGL